MVYNGCKRKFDVLAYIKKFKGDQVAKKEPLKLNSGKRAK
jgi:hypothetical protein